MMLGNKLKILRKTRGLSLKRLSEITNISLSFLSDIEHGRTNPSIEKLLILSDKLEVPPSYFFSGESSLESLYSYPELLDLLKDFPLWNEYDKNELICYLRAKQISKNSALKNF